MRFTQEEFDTMVQEVLYTEPSCSDMLCDMAQRLLQPMVDAWCRKDPVLRGRQFEGDVMNDILLHLMRTVVHGFLLRDDVAGPYNNDPEGFERWVCLVAHNRQRDFADRIRRADFHTTSEEELDTVGVYDETPEEYQARICCLRKAFEIVMDSDARVYKVLTWLAQTIFIAEQDLEHHQANALVVTAFENKTLFEMYNMILIASRRIPWMQISLPQHKRVVEALQKPWDEDLTYGEVKYGAFFMKYRGEVAGKKSVSDWINRMNNLIRRVMGDSEKWSEESDLPDEEDKKRRGEDGSSEVG